MPPHLLDVPNTRLTVRILPLFSFPPQFLVYGGYFAVISLVFFVAALCKLANRKRSEPDASADGTTAPPPADGT